MDLGDPARPISLSSVDIGYRDSSKVILSGTLAYVVTWDSVTVVDVSDPTRLAVIASHVMDDRGDPPATAAVFGDRLYAACGNNGLLVFSLARE